jgi:hypothetical protein
MAQLGRRFELEICGPVSHIRLPSTILGECSRIGEGINYKPSFVVYYPLEISLYDREKPQRIAYGRLPSAAALFGFSKLYWRDWLLLIVILIELCMLSHKRDKSYLYRIRQIENCCMASDDILTKKEANVIARDMVNARIPYPKGFIFFFPQKHYLMEELADLCVKHTLEHNGSDIELEDKIKKAWDIIQDIWRTTAPDYANKYYDDEETIDEDLEKKIEEAEYIIWQRHDPMSSFHGGYESPHYFELNTSTFSDVVADYLEKPYLRHPVLDWIFLDIFITSEICIYGEKAKQETPRGGSRYWDAKGNIKNMTKVNWSELGESLWNKFLFAIVFPIGAIWAAIHFKYEIVGAVLMFLYALVIFIYCSCKILGFVKRTISRVAGRRDPRLAPFHLVDSMYVVWQRLDGSVINPTRVLDAMEKSAEEGAVWDMAAWSIINRVISHDPAVWIVKQTRKNRLF